MEKGIEKGMEKGILAVAINAKKMGVSPAEIAEMTGLSEEDIERL